MDRVDFIKLSTMGGLGLGLPHINRFDNPTNIGIIGLDTSYCIKFTEIINNPETLPGFLEFQIVAAYPRGSRNIQSSVSRVTKYTRKIKKMGV